MQRIFDMYKTPNHGIYSLSIKQSLVTNDYSESFNIGGVEALIADLLEVTKDLDAWVLLQRPESNVGVTQDALIPMMQGYLKLQQAGCKAVGIVENSLFVHSGTPHNPAELTMPINIHKDEHYLREWLEKILKKIKI
ncbi:hypothetical protein QTP81_12785 [Alteromonas sp. ASW11-36]|uniref:Uncharacterized protein n=1 Tax=Alteromonas arenosi TaxID=3055817 RepID=A0ABT7SZ67_9ALTE|nr:hypothetical protein [Alteromonas sp. ASW11-36]MDM7861470.1 hypothetical protein [Alteromonas sp. ASW11-36]